MTNDKQILPAVAAAIFDDTGRILMHKRASENAWCIVSGHVEFGETVEQAIVREIKEETGADAKVLSLIGVYSSPASQLYETKEGNIQYVTVYFEVQLLQPLAEVIVSDETLDVCFFEVNKLPDDLAKINPYWLDDALNKKEQPFYR